MTGSGGPRVWAATRHMIIVGTDIEVSVSVARVCVPGRSVETESQMSETVRVGDLVQISDTAGTWSVEEVRSGIALLRDGEDRRISSRLSKLTVVRRGTPS